MILFNLKAIRFVCVYSISMKFLIETKKVISKISAIDDRHLLEFIGLERGFKKVLRIHIEKSVEYEILCDYAKKFNFLIHHSSFKLKVSWQNKLGDTFLENVSWDNEEAEQFVAYLSYDKHLLETALDIELNGAHIDAGSLYGYPECCSQNYVSISEGKYWLDSLLENSTGLQFEYKANKLSYLTSGLTLFPDYFNCSFNCKQTMNLSDEYERIGREFGLGKDIDNIISHMKGFFLIQGVNVIRFSEYNFINNTVKVNLNNISVFGEEIMIKSSDEIIFELEKIDANYEVTFIGKKYRAILFT